MASELPYFKFIISEYLNGEIFLEDYRTQGVFVNICAYYWHHRCDLTLPQLKKKFKDIDAEILILSSEKIIKVKGEKITINFLDEQWNSKEVVKVINRANGAKGGRPKKPTETEIKPNGLSVGLEIETETKANVNPNVTNIDKIIVDKIKEDDNVNPKITPSHNFYYHSDFEKVEWTDEFCLFSTRHSGLTIERVKELLPSFLLDQKGKSRLIWEDEPDAKQHFINWLKKQPKQQSISASRRVDN